MSKVVSTTIPLADSFQRCSSSFKELYLALFAYGPISLSKFNDEYGRFGVWGSDSGADRSGRGSLDDVLRNDPKATSIIAEVLENLDEDLNICIALVKAPASPHEAQPRDGQEWLSDEESSVSSRSDSGDCQIVSRVSSKTQRILHLLAIIVDHIQSLFQVSTLLRRATISDKYLRSTSKRKIAETESPFHPWDLAHIIEKSQFWINQQKWDLPAEKNKAEDIQHQMRNYLCKRLATANVKRRQQLYFWQIHPAQPNAINLPNEQIGPKPAIISNPIATGELPKKVVPRSEISKPSHGTKQSFSTVTKSDLNDSATFSGRPRTEYVSSTKGGKYVLRVPLVPKILGGSPTLRCPYCSTALDAKSMFRRELWKKHVFRDLRPYVCTFEQCENPEKLYLTRHDWMYHEMQMYRRQWICASCSHQKFFSRNDMKGHLLAKHAGQFPESQLMIMVDICERPMDDDEDVDCPICLATLSLSALKAHLATHLEELALFVLPCLIEGRSQDTGSVEVEGIAGQHLASNASSSEDGLPPLEFEESLPDVSYSQDPEIFANLLQSTITFEQTHMEDWFLTNDQAEPRDDKDGTGTTALLSEASTFMDQGRWGGAKDLEVQVMETSKKKLGTDRETTLAPDHPDQPASQHTLAMAYRASGQVQKAVELLERALLNFEKTFGVEHIPMLDTIKGLGLLYADQGKLEEAEQMYQRALQGFKKAWGPEHPRTLKTMDNLADVLESQYKYDEAEPLFREALQLSEKVLGKEHPETLESIDSLANNFKSQGKYDEAEPLSREALQLREKVLGKEHPQTLSSKRDLVGVLKSQGIFNTSEVMH